MAERTNAPLASWWARAAAEELTRGTNRVRFARSIHVPEDEICFYVFDASTARDAAHAAERAGLDPIRVVEAVASTEEESDDDSPANERSGGEACPHPSAHEKEKR